MFETHNSVYPYRLRKNGANNSIVLLSRIAQMLFLGTPNFDQQFVCVIIIDKM